MMGDKNLRVPGTYRHHHPVPKLHKLREWREEEIMMGDKNLRVADPWHHHPVPNSKKGDKRRL